MVEGSKEQQKQRRGMVVVAAGAAALGTIVAAKLLLGLLRCRDRDPSKDIKFKSSLTPSEILRNVDNVIADSTRVHDSVSALPLDKLSYETVIAPLAKLEAEEFARVQSCVFPSLVSPSKDVRDASIKAEKMFEAYNGQCRLRDDVYRVVKAYSQKGEILQPEAQRFIDHLVRDYERLGLHLSSQERLEVEKLKRAIGELCITYQRNLAQENAFLLFGEDELAGVPPAFTKELEKGKHGKLKVPLDVRHYFPVMQNCKEGSTRKALAAAYDRRCVAENVPILYNVVKLRHKLARLLGFSNHVEYVTSIRMAKSFLNVKYFLLSLSAKMSPIAAAELDKLRAMKKAEEGDSAFGMEDLLFYMHRVEELEYRSNPENAKEYFPLELVTARILKFYEELLGLAFEECQGHEIWHPDVRLFLVRDSETREKVGYFYLDIYHRDGKYPHACVCPLQPALVHKENVQLPVAAMLANFVKGNSTLLSHPEVETFFHEFGHIMHHICSRQSFARFSGLRVEDDFVEAPSKMLEKWCSDSTFLKRLSKDSTQQVSDEMCARLVRRKRIHAGLLTKRQIMLALFDLIIHSGDDFDSVSVLQKLHLQVMEGIPMLEGTDLSASFSHLMGGYDGSYYSYLWSQVLSEDMFDNKFSGDMYSKAAGKHLRLKVFTKGATKDANEIVQDFVGREPSLSAYVKSRAAAAATASAAGAQ